MPDADINKITHENAMKWCRFDPFKDAPRSEATVGALRAAAAGHDVSIKNRSHQIISAKDKVDAYHARFLESTQR